MKKITLLIFMSLLSFVGFSQVFPEGFEGVFPPPTGPGGTSWVVSHNGIGMGPGNANLWVKTPPGSAAAPPHSGDFAVTVERINIGDGNTEEDWLISPLVTVPANGQLRFYALHGRAGDQGSKLRIKVSTTSQTDLSTFTTQVVELTESQISATAGVHVEQVVNLAGIVPANQQVYIAFIRVHTHVGSGPSGDRFVLDDINLVQQCLDPANGVANAITTTTANLSWDNPSGSTDWEIELIPTTATFTGTGTPINTNPYPAQNLTPGTVYQYKVRSKCPGNVYSNWVGPFYFTTVSLGQTCAAPIAINSLPYSTTDNTGNYGNHITGNQGTTGCGATGNYLTGNDVVYSYTATFTGMIDIAMTPTDTYSGIFVYDNCASIGTSCLAGVGNSNSSVRNITNFPVTTGTTYYFVISTNASPDTIGYTLVIQQINCPPPTALTVGTLSMTSADLSWGNPSGATEWQVVVQTPGAGIPAGAGTTVTSLPFNATTTFAGVALTAGSNYEYYVRAKCPDGSFSQWSGPKPFQLPMCNNACNFSFIMTDSYGDGWNGNTINILQNGIVVATLTGPTDADDTNPITAQVPLCAGIPFEVYWNDGGAFASEVGLTVITPFGITVYTKPPGTGTQDTSLYTGPTDCTPPTCPQPTALVVSGATTNSIQANWTEAGTATAWEVIALPAGSPSPNTTPPTSGIISVITNPSQLIDLLPSDTNFDVYVRAVCSPTDSSYWTGPATIKTLPDYCAGDHFYDDGGENGNYSNGANITTTICPTNPGDIVTIEFNSFDIEATYDFLSVYDGTGTSGTLLGTYTGDLTGNLPGPFESSVPGGCITFVFTSDAIVNNPGWDATITCGPPPTCPRPTAVTISNITQTGATIDWTEAGTASLWEIIVLPAGSAAPGANPPDIITTSIKPYLIPEGTLFPSTSYDVYVRAVCSPTDRSNWSFKKTFTTKPVNDDCNIATTVPVNNTTACTLTTPGTIMGATASTTPVGCGGTADDDVWYQFTATNTTHSIKLLNVTGSTTDLYHALYTGADCGNLTELYCSDPNTSIANNLVIGQTYYIRVYSYTSTPGQTSSYNLCVATPAPPIATNNTQYTVPQLVQDVLIGSTCAQVSNITWSTGSNFGSDNGIAYFTRNGSTFPIENGIVLSTGNALNAKGPNTNTLSDGTSAWTGDTQLLNYIQSLGIDDDLEIYRNATILEFDFVPLTNQLSFDFLFASEEYGQYQCTFSDAFAFFLTDSNGNTTNLAIVPGTTDPISVTRIRDSAYNNDCPSINPQYFGAYNGDDNAEDASIDFNGQTVVMTAQSPVTPNTTYHIKLVIADRNDTMFDSAVFLKAGSFNIGNVDLGDDLLVSEGTAICYGDSYTIDTGLNPAEFTFTWSTVGGGVIPGATGPSLTVTQDGEYTVTAQYNGTTCSQTDTISVEFYDPITANVPNDMTACDASGYSVFDLTSNNATILGNMVPAAYAITYHTTSADAEGDTNPIATPEAFTNTQQYNQTIYVRVENITTGCFTVIDFDLIIQDLTPQFTITPDFTICSNQTGQIVVTPTNYNPADVVYSWTHNTNPLPDTTGTITVSQQGTYVVTINHSGCITTGTVNVTVNPGVQPTFNQIAPICEGSTAPTLPATSIEGVTGTWSPAVISNTATGTYTFTPTTGQCGDPATMTVTVIPSPVPTFNAIAPICSGGIAPTLPITSNEGITGTWSPATVSNTATGTYTFTPDAGQCAKQGTLIVTVQAPFTFDIVGDCIGNQFVLEVQTADSGLDLNNAHFQWYNNNGTAVGTDSSTFNVSEYFASSTVTPNLPTQFRVKVTSAAGCSLEKFYTVEQIYCQIQKGISPNNDGLNDSFDLTGFNVQKLSIFNRYGGEVYSHGTGYTNQWMGQSKGGSELPDGTYFYVIELKGGDTKTGWVYINREK